MLVLGIDPGASGAIVVLDGRDGIDIIKLCETEADIGEFVRRYVGGHAFIEVVHSMPKQGVASSFTFGRSYGFLRGLLAGLQIPFDEVRPQAWQKAMGCLTKGDKNASKAAAQRLFPKLKVCHYNADALLIAEHGRRVLNQRNGHTERHGPLDATMR